MKNKKLYICGVGNNNKSYEKMYTSIKELKLDNLSWTEFGIYEIKISKTRCIEEPLLFESADEEEQINIEKSEISETQHSETFSTLFGKISHVFKKKQEIDWADTKGNKEYKWRGKCDACREQKSNLTVIHSATLSGVTICRECKIGEVRS
jgi:hypothetical protein